MRPRSYCAKPGCSMMSVKGSAFCENHRQARRRDYDRVYDQGRGTSAARGYDKAWHRSRGKKLKEQPTCERCGQPADTVHHRRPLRQGGTNDAGNLMSVCRACHLALHPEKGGGRRGKGTER